MSIIKPTVGRVVHYYPADGEPLAAIITRVWNDVCINIAYFDGNGAAHSKTSVLLMQDGVLVPDSLAPDGDYAAWMPYQKGQAAKTEAVQREAIDHLLGTRIPILDQISDLCYAIEKCGASPELTDAVTKASALRDPISELVRQALALGIGAGIVGVNESPEREPVASDVIKQQIQAKGLTAPRVTLEDIEASIAAEHYFTAGQALAALNHPVSDGLELLTICVIMLRNGTKIVGINYGAIDPAQHSEERGRKAARDNAIDQIWPLLGYELRSRLNQHATTCTCAPGEGCTRCGTGLSGE